MLKCLLHLQISLWFTHDSVVCFHYSVSGEKKAMLNRNKQRLRTHKSVCGCCGPALAARISEQMPEIQMTKERGLDPVSSPWIKHVLQPKSSKRQCENKTLFQP